MDEDKNDKDRGKSAKEREQDAKFEELYRYHPRVVSFLTCNGFPREDARELANDAFVRVYTSMDDYRGESKLSYLLTVARRVALNAIRDKYAAKRHGKMVSDDVLVDLADPRAQPPDKNIDSAKRTQYLHEAIAKLPEADRKLLMMQLDGKSYEEIGEGCGLSVAAVKTRLYKARQQLRTLLGANWDWLVTDAE